MYACITKCVVFSQGLPRFVYWPSLSTIITKSIQLLSGHSLYKLMLLQTVIKFKLSGSLLLHYCPRVFLFVEVEQLQVLQPNFVSILKILFLLMATGNPSTSQCVESSVFGNSFICTRNNRELSLYKYWRTQQLNSTLIHFIIDI